MKKATRNLILAAILLIVATGAQAQVLPGGSGSRVEGDLTTRTEINGAVLAAGTNVLAQVGGIRISGSRVDGDIDSQV
ncbi:MAG: hypothetical protein GY719_20435, partial [bacterium]|nr:hypothetical protein [bacterium]